MNVLHELRKTKTIVLISHRLANTVQSDCIYFLKDGTITEKGTFNTLIAHKGDYYTLYENQKMLETYGDIAS